MCYMRYPTLVEKHLFQTIPIMLKNRKIHTKTQIVYYILPYLQKFIPKINLLNEYSIERDNDHPWVRSVEC